MPGRGGPAPRRGRRFPRRWRLCAAGPVPNLRPEAAMARIAFVADELFEDSELRVPWDRLRQAGHETVLVGLEAGKELDGKRGKEHVTTDVAARDVTADDFEALVIPGGYSPDRLRTSLDM